MNSTSCIFLYVYVLGYEYYDVWSGHEKITERLEFHTPSDEFP